MLSQIASSSLACITKVGCSKGRMNRYLTYVLFLSHPLLPPFMWLALHPHISVWVTPHSNAGTPCHSLSWAQAPYLHYHFQGLPHNLFTCLCSASSVVCGFCELRGQIHSFVGTVRSLASGQNQCIIFLCLTTGNCKGLPGRLLRNAAQPMLDSMHSQSTVASEGSCSQGPKAPGRIYQYSCPGQRPSYWRPLLEVFSGASAETLFWGIGRRAGNLNILFLTLTQYSVHFCF